MYKKSQAAVEFLSTYAWVFVALAATMGALYYFGVFDFSRYLPQKCIFPTQFKCLDFSLKPSEIRVKLSNDIGEDVKVISALITNEAAAPISCSTITPSVPFDWAHSSSLDLVFADCTGGAYLSGENAELIITMRYYSMNTPTHPEHEINGKINGKVTSS